MKKILLFITLFYGVTFPLYSQKSDSADGVVSFALPIRNSIKYNRFAVNPAFSFVREQGTVASFTTKDNGYNLMMRLNRICLVIQVVLEKMKLSLLVYFNKIMV